MVYKITNEHIIHSYFFSYNCIKCYTLLYKQTSSYYLSYYKTYIKHSTTHMKKILYTNLKTISIQMCFY